MPGEDYPIVDGSVSGLTDVDITGGTLSVRRRVLDNSGPATTYWEVGLPVSKGYVGVLYGSITGDSCLENSATVSLTLNTDGLGTRTGSAVLSNVTMSGPIRTNQAPGNPPRWSFSAQFQSTGTWTAS